MLLSSRLNQARSLSLSSYIMCFRSVTILVDLLWILSSISIGRPHTWKQCSRCLMRAKQREGSLPWPAGYSLANAAQYLVSLHCCKDTLLTHVLLVLHQHLSSNQLHQQSWKVLSSPLGDYILLPSVCKHSQTGERRKGTCRCFLCTCILWSGFLCFAQKPNWSSAHAAKPESLPSFRRREDSSMVGVSREWDYCKLGIHLERNIPFSLGWGGECLLVFIQLICIRYVQKMPDAQLWVLINNIKNK